MSFARACSVRVSSLFVCVRVCFAAGMVFKGQTFHPLATLSKEVPILTTGGVAKQVIGLRFVLLLLLSLALLDPG